MTKSSRKRARGCWRIADDDAPSLKHGEALPRAIKLEAMIEIGELTANVSHDRL